MPPAAFSPSTGKKGRCNYTRYSVYDGRMLQQSFTVDCGPLVPLTSRPGMVHAAHLDDISRGKLYSAPGWPTRCITSIPSYALANTRESVDDGGSEIQAIQAHLEGKSKGKPACLSPSGWAMSVLPIPASIWAVTLCPCISDKLIRFKAPGLRPVVDVAPACSRHRR